MDKLIKTLFALILVNPAFGQDQVEMADQLRAEGKIYVVVTIILIVLAGLIFYLFLLDKKVKKLEKLLSDKKKQTN
ncbi:MAG TPA: CcmD family protein [Cyclobacteriaceae bacterium]